MCSARSFSDASSSSSLAPPGQTVPAIGFSWPRGSRSHLTTVSGELPTSASVAELEQEEVRRWVDATQRAVELDRGGGRRPLGALRDDDLEGVAFADVLLRALDTAETAVLFFLELPLDGFNRTRLDSDLKEVELDPGTASARVALANLAGSAVLPTFKKTNLPPIHLKFSELSVHASRQQSRDYFEGRTVILEGQFRRSEGKDNEFQLFRVMVNCCGTDSITLRSRIIAPEPLQGYNKEDWVRIEGELSFQKIAGRNEWMPVIQLPTMQSIQKIPAPADPNKDV